jgi:hypothetical protein
MRCVAVISIAIVMVLAGCQARPTAAPDFVSAPTVGPMDINVLANDSDASNRPLIVTDAGHPLQGTTSINRNSTIHYVPRAGASGEDHFTYRIRNSQGRSATGQVTIRFPDSAKAAPPITAAAAPEATPASDPQKPTATSDPQQSATSSPPPSPPPSNPPAKPAPKPAPAPAPAPAPVAPVSASSTMDGIVVTLFTRDDDKDAGEPVQLTIKRGEAVVTQRTIGEDETWPVQSDRTEEFTLDPPVSIADAAGMSLEVRKLITTPGIGGSWVMQVDVQGRLADGRIIMLVPKSLPFRMGGGSSNNRTWQFKPK